MATFLAGIVKFLGVVLAKPFRRARAKAGLHGVDISVETDPRRMDSSHASGTARSYYFAEAPPSSPSDEHLSWWEWARAHNGEDEGTSLVVVTVQGSSADAVAVLRPRVRSTRKDIDGGQVRMPTPTGGAGILARHYEARLEDDGVSECKYAFQSDERPESFMLGKGETERIVLMVTAPSPGRYEWSVLLDMTHNGVTRTHEIRNGRRPFVTVGTSGAGIPCYVWDFDRWTQMRVPD